MDNVVHFGVVISLGCEYVHCRDEDAAACFLGGILGGFDHKMIVDRLVSLLGGEEYHKEKRVSRLIITRKYWVKYKVPFDLYT